MKTRMTGDSQKLLERAVFLFLSFFVVLLFIAAIWGLGPFYGHSLDNTAVEVIAQVVSGINGYTFQCSLGLYVWYSCTWIFVVVAICLMRMLSLYPRFFVRLRLNGKHFTRKFFIYVKRVVALNVVKRLCRRLTWSAKGKGQGLEKRHDEEANEGVLKKGKEWKTYTLHISVILIVALVFFTYRYAVFPVPQGFDTSWYIYVARNMRQDPIQVLKLYSTSRALSLAIIYAMGAVFGFMMEQAMMFLTPLIGIVYVVGVYVLVLTGTKNKLLALLAALFTPLTFATIRLSMDLYSNYIAWSFAMYALSLYIRTMETKKARFKYFVATGIVFMLVALTHVWTFMFLTAIILLHNLVELLTKGEYRRTIGRTLVVYTPFLVLAFLIPGLGIGVLSLLEPSSAAEPFQYASRENPYILVLAIIGIVAVMNRRQTTYTRTLISWTMVTTTVLITGMLPWPDRVMCLMPTAILAAHGTQSIHNTVTKYPSLKSVRKPILPLIGLLCFTAMLPHAYLPDFFFTPSSEGMQQLHWLEQHYGFNNPNLIVLINSWRPTINDTGYSNYFGWTMATVGDVAWSGQLLDMIQSLAGNPENLEETTILIPDRFYRMSSLEYQATYKVSELGIYEVKNKSLAQLYTMMRHENVWSDDAFQSGVWSVLGQGYYNYQLTNESSVGDISFTPLQSDKWFALEKRFSAPVYDAKYLILRAKGTLENVDFFVEAWSDGDPPTVTRFTETVYSAGYVFLTIPFQPGLSLSRIRLAFLSQDVLNIESHFQMDYIVIL